MKQVKLRPTTDELLTEISDKRKSQDHLNASKQGIVAELILALHKKEVLMPRRAQGPKDK